MQEYNQKLAEEKRLRESKWRDNQEQMNQSEISRTNMSDIMTENAKTTQSQLAPHRFVPYHFKGLRPEQKEEIMAVRSQQVDENAAEKQNVAEEEYQWAVQNLANTQHFLNNELELQERQKQMQAATRDANLDEKVKKDERWPNMYGDLNPLPNVTKDMVAGADPRAIN